MDSHSALAASGTPRNVLPYRPASAASLHVYGPATPGRELIETYIQRRYAQRFGARLSTWLPTLVSLEASGEIVAAAGYRVAREPLYLERYLERPIETYLTTQDSRTPDRAQIVEAGQFASDRAAGRLLVPLMAQHLRASGYGWVICTLTAELEHMFKRMGLTPCTLVAADPGGLSAAECDAWGSYYAHSPHVVAERLTQVVEQLEAR